jgi:uncharacterized protein (DUF433 family)
MMQSVLTRHIEVTKGVRGGRPRIAQTRVAVADVAVMYLRLGRSLEEIASDYDLPLAAVHDAMAYYYDHRAEIDRDIADDRSFAEAFAAGNPSLLRAKLESLNRG